MVNPMKQIILTLIICLAAALRPAAVAAVSKEAGQAATLTIHHVSPDPRVEKLRIYLGRKNPELTELSDHFVREADRLSLDWRLVAAISGLESSFCKFIPSSSYNCWGWGIPTGASHGIVFQSYSDGITKVSEGLRKRYFDRGMVTIEDVGKVYAASPTWASRVRFFMNDIESFDTYAERQLAMTLTE
jgi:hypothetical protein